MNLVELLREQAQARPMRPAIVDPRRARPPATTFAQLDAATERVAGLLREAGLRSGDTVLILQPMSKELYVALGAVFRLGLVGMFLDPTAGLAHVARCCALMPPRALIGSSRAHALRLLSPALRAIPIKFVIGPPVPGAIPWSRSRHVRAHGEVERCGPDAPALVTFTSGSTGEPRAAVRTHGFLLTQHRALASTLQPVDGDVDLTTLPIVLLGNLASGVTSVIPDADVRRPGALGLGHIVAQVQTYGVTTSAATPTFFERLARYCLVHRIVLPRVRQFVCGGAPVFPHVMDALRRVAPDATVIALYGSTEAEPIARVPLQAIGADERERVRQGGGLLAGRSVDAIRLRVVRDRWGDVPGAHRERDFAAECLTAGEPGEIVVSGSHVLPGYLNGTGDGETKVRADGAIWHRTGDAGYLDAEGRLWLLGRCAARIQDRYGTLYPLAAEAAIADAPGIGRSAFVAHAGRRVLLVEPGPAGVRPDVASLRERLGWARVDEVRLRRRIPVDRRHNAKIDYPRLARMLSKEYRA